MEFVKRTLNENIDGMTNFYFVDHEFFTINKGISYGIDKVNSPGKFSVEVFDGNDYYLYVCNSIDDCKKFIIDNNEDVKLMKSKMKII